MQVLRRISVPAKTDHPESSTVSLYKSLRTSSNSPPPSSGVCAQRGQSLEFLGRECGTAVSPSRHANEPGDFFFFQGALDGLHLHVARKGAQGTRRGLWSAVGLGRAPGLPLRLRLAGVKGQSQGRGRQLFSAVTAATQIMPPQEANELFLSPSSLLPAPKQKGRAWRAPLLPANRSSQTFKGHGAPLLGGNLGELWSRTLTEWGLTTTRRLRSGRPPRQCCWELQGWLPVWLSEGVEVHCWPGWRSCASVRGQGLPWAQRGSILASPVGLNCVCVGFGEEWAQSPSLARNMGWFGE